MTYPQFGAWPRTLEDVAEHVDLEWRSLVTIGCSPCGRSAVRAVKVLNGAEWGTRSVPSLPAEAWIFEAGKPQTVNKSTTNEAVHFHQTVHLITDDGSVEQLGVFSLGFKSPRGVCSRCNRWIRFAAVELQHREGSKIWGRYRK